MRNPTTDSRCLVITHSQVPERTAYAALCEVEAWPDPDSVFHTPPTSPLVSSDEEPETLDPEFEMNAELGEPQFGKAGMVHRLW